jgi:hypothetical protein
MSDNGSFYLTSSIAGGGFLAWDAADATLQIQGSINVTGGNAATQTYANTAATNVSSSLSPSIFTDSSGRIRRPPTITPATSGLYIGSTNLGYYNGSGWKTYMADNGNFYLDGATGSLSWIADTDTLEINGVINVIGGNAATQTYANSAASSAASSAQSAAQATAASYVTQLANGGWTAGNGTFITSNSIFSPVIAGDAGYISTLFKVGQNGITLDGTNKKIYIGSGTWDNTNTGFYVDSDGKFSLKKKLTWDGTDLNITGNITVTGGNALKTGDAAGDVNSGATTITGTKITTDTITANNISSLAFTGKTAEFDTGEIGGWTITPSSLASKKDSNGLRRLVLDPSPQISVLNGNGVGKLFIKAGDLTPYDGGSSIKTLTFAAATLPSLQDVTGLSQQYTGNGTSFTIDTAGTYVGNITSPAFNNIGALGGSGFGGAVNISLWYQISTDIGFSNIIANEVISTVNIYSYSQTSAGSFSMPAGNASISREFATGTYYSRARWVVFITAYASNVDINGKTYNATTANISLQTNFAELTEVGFQMVRDSNTFFRIERDALQGTNQAYVKIGGKLEVTGDIISLASDRRLKENIIPIDGALDKINKINGVYFNYTDNARKANPHFGEDRQVGLIAQEIQEVLPEVVNFAPFDFGTDNTSVSGDNYLTLNYDKVVPLLLQAIKELKFELDEVKKLIK